MQINMVGVAVCGLLLAAAAGACSGAQSSADANANASAPACVGPTPAAGDVDPSAGYDGGGVAPAGSDGFLNDGLTSNAFGAGRTLSTAAPLGAIVPSLSSAWNQSLGTNGRACHDCHRTEEGWTLTPSGLRGRFATDQLQAIFQTNDGSVSPKSDTSTPDARRSAFALLLGKGLIRVGIAMPDGAEFRLGTADDPYGFASATELSLFRRPLPAQNLKFLTDVMWDGRETSPCQTITSDLGSQATHAVLGHARGLEAPPRDVLKEVVDFERSLFFAQSTDVAAGALDADGARGGSTNLSRQPFAFGMNDAPFDPHVFDLYDAWSSPPATATNATATNARRAIARGQALFNTRAFTIRDVRGMNDDLGQAEIKGTCSTCHNTPNVGNNSRGRRFDIGVSDESRRGADVPLYTFVNIASGEERRLSDPGRGLVTGKWADLGRFKVPSLRGLAARAPYFHDGSAPDIAAVVGTLDRRFGIELTPDETNDLVAFLRAL